MKKYVIFAWDQYYPGGGLGDLVGDEDDLEAAKAICLANKFVYQFGKNEHTMSFDYAQIVDRDTWEVIWDREG